MSNHKGPIEIHLFLIVTTEAIVSIVHTDKLSLLLFVFHIVFKTPELNWLIHPSLNLLRAICCIILGSQLYKLTIRQRRLIIKAKLDQLINYAFCKKCLPEIRDVNLPLHPGDWWTQNIVLAWQLIFSGLVPDLVVIDHSARYMNKNNYDLKHFSGFLWSLC